MSGSGDLPLPPKIIQPVDRPRGSPMWSLDYCNSDLKLAGVPPQRRAERIQRYQQNARLTFDQRGPGLVDSVGEWYPIPPATVRVVTANAKEFPHGTPGAVIANYHKELLFFDAAGHVLLVVLNYGWDARTLRRWLQAAGWSYEISSADFPGGVFNLMKTYPTYFYAPFTPVGLGYQVRPTVGQRIKGLFRHHSGVNVDVGKGDPASRPAEPEAPAGPTTR